MSYVQGGDIEAADYNGFRNTTIAVYGVGTADRGYGQTTIPLPVVLGGHVEVPKSIEWTRLRSALVVLSNHQGTSLTLPSAGALAAGQEIKAHPPAAGNFPTSVTSVDTNRLVVGGSSTTIFSDVLNSTRATAWQTILNMEFTVAFASADAARYFFNSGGQIRIHGARSGGASNPQNTEWTNFLTDIGSILFGAHATSYTGTKPTGSSIGYYELTTSYQTVYSAVDPESEPYYTANDVFVQVKSNGPQGANSDNGSLLTFKVVLQNDYYPYPDSIDGNLTVTVDERRATTYLTGITGGTYTLIDPL